MNLIGCWKQVHTGTNEISLSTLTRYPCKGKRVVTRESLIEINKRLSYYLITVRNTLREIELQNDYRNGCGLTDHGCGMTLLSNELQIRTIGSIPGITGHN